MKLQVTSHFVISNGLGDSFGRQKSRRKLRSYKFFRLPEELLPGESSSVVELSVCEDAEQGGLAGVDVSDDGHADLHEVLLLVAAPNKVLPRPSRSCTFKSSKYLLLHKQFLF